MTKLKIKVTKEILMKSRMCGVELSETVSSNCAIAVAVREIFPHAHVTEYIEVWDGPFPGTDARCIGTIDLPFEALVFIKNFDDAAPWDRVGMEEIEFEVDIPNWFLKTINIDEVKELLKTSSILELKTA
jgi:hypothetical protein